MTHLDLQFDAEIVNSQIVELLKCEQETDCVSDTSPDGEKCSLDNNEDWNPETIEVIILSDAIFISYCSYERIRDCFSPLL